MLRQISGKKITERDSEWWRAARAGYTKLILDLGCGDGGWAYAQAKARPEALVLGIDPDAVSLEKFSHKAGRKPEKGGLANLLYFQAAVEGLPAELAGQISEIHINFPWGSLLGGVARADSAILAEITKLAAPDAILQIFTTFSPEFEPETIQKLELPQLADLRSARYAAAWGKCGWQLISADYAFTEKIPQTAWWKTISHRRVRQVLALELQLEHN